MDRLIEIAFKGKKVSHYTVIQHERCLRLGNTAKLRFMAKVTTIHDQTATIHVFPRYCGGLEGITSYSHLIILYWAHLRDNEEERRTLLVYPKRHGRKVETGVFACRSPSRPNPVCLCVVKLLKIERCNLLVRGLDAVEGSPIVDIKPYHPHSDSVPEARFPEWVLHGPSK
jgi:tRNA-Thr(GGU) m(6)t(6)A37 methyltransferase TsaA